MNASMIVDSGYSDVSTAASSPGRNTSEFPIDTSKTFNLDHYTQNKGTNFPPLV
jgi:hypothetical protein